MVGLVFLFLFRSFRTDRTQVNRNISPLHTREAVNDRIGERLGQAQWRLYAMIGDQLDQKTGWIRTPEVVMQVLRDNPQDVLDFLLEVHGERKVTALLERRRREVDTGDDRD